MTTAEFEKNIWKSIFNDTSCYVYWLDKNNVYQGCNHSYATLVGLHSTNDILGKTNLELWHGVDITIIEKIDSNNFETLRANDSKMYEEKIITSNQNELSLLSQKTVIKDNFGNALGLLGISFNISDMKKKELELTHVNELTKTTLHQIIDFLPTYVYWKDINGVYLGCNAQQAKSLAKMAGNSIIGKTDFDLPWGESVAETYRKNDIEVMQTKSVKIVEEKGAIDDLQQRIFISQKAPLFNKNKDVIGVIGVSVDITEYKQMQKELAAQIVKVKQADREKTSFITVASHEIKGPLNNAMDILAKTKNFLENTKNKDLNEDLYALVLDAIQDVKKGKESLENLVRFINIDAHNYKNISEVSLKDFLNRYHDNAKNLKIQINIDPSVPNNIGINSIYLTEVCDILIENAINFSKAGGLIIIQATLIDALDSRKILELVVEDFGAGINNNSLKNFFTPLLPNNSDETEKRYITPAIKLSFVKKLTESLGGTFEITSLINKGTKAKIFIPITLNEHNTHIMNEPNKSIYETLKVLVVEDNALTLKLIKSKLNGFLTCIDTALNGEEAEAQIIKNKYHIIFIDISLPDMDGVELKRRISKILDEDVFFIAVTSHNSEADREYFINTEGFNDVLEKPVAENDLKNCVDTIINVYFDTV